MSSSLQTIAALAIVAVTAGWLLWRAFAKRQAGCGGGCGCPSAEIKATLKTKA
jgi:FeoB-associated Cys-rich membrane protein